MTSLWHLLLSALVLTLTLAGCGDGGGDLDAAPDCCVVDGAIADAGAPDARAPDAGAVYPADPFAGLNKVNSSPDIYWGNSSFGDGKGQLVLWAPAGYTPQKPWPLMVFLHGGGKETDNKQSQVQAFQDIKQMVLQGQADQFVWIAGVIRTQGSYHAWIVKQNTLDLIDAIREVSKRFRVDQRRVYLSGASMGGGGTASISWMIPHAFAAFGPVAGYYWNQWCAVPDLTGVQYRVVHGALDKVPRQPFDRLKLAEEFVKLSAAAGAVVDKVILPGVGHQYPASEMPKMNQYMLKHTSASPTDWAKARKIVETFK